MNMTLYFDDYGPAYTDTIGWILVATNSMTKDQKGDEEEDRDRELEN